jgi:hypothetical protein
VHQEESGGYARKSLKSYNPSRVDDKSWLGYAMWQEFPCKMPAIMNRAQGVLKNNWWWLLVLWAFLLVGPEEAGKNALENIRSLKPET